MALIDIDSARKIIWENIKESVKTEYINIEDCSGRILDEKIICPLDMPSFNRSKMDGWAIRSFDSPGKFRITGYLQAGAIKKSYTNANGYTENGVTDVIEEMETYKIMTGAPVIKGADSVLQIESCRVEGDYVYIEEAVQKGNNIACKGEDIAKNQLLIEKGTRLTAQHVSLIASAGYNQIRVKKHLEAAILVTGNELQEPVNSSEFSNDITLPGEGTIFNSNGPAFMALCKENKINGRYMGSAGDTFKEFREKLTDCLESDIVIISGGVSVGDYDLVRQGLKEAGAKELFYKVASKPGKPLLVCKIEETLIFGFPGNPVSSMVGFREFLLPAIRKINDEKKYLPTLIPAVFKGNYTKNDNRDHFINVRLYREGEKLIAEEVKSNSSGDTVSFSASDALLRVSGNSVNNGDIVEVELVRNI